ICQRAGAVAEAEGEQVRSIDRDIFPDPPDLRTVLASHESESSPDARIDLRLHDFASFSGEEKRARCHRIEPRVKDALDRRAELSTDPRRNGSRRDARHQFEMVVQAHLSALLAPIDTVMLNANEDRICPRRAYTLRHAQDLRAPAALIVGPAVASALVGQ